MSVAFSLEDWLDKSENFTWGGCTTDQTSQGSFDEVGGGGGPAGTWKLHPRDRLSYTSTRMFPEI